ncbi:MAG: hypothetical protein GY821_14325, partial [Gammaproteobacteria bacterium]|nr:hypothetical protein [Gammaproteobacteria bacterium]
NTITWQELHENGAANGLKPENGQLLQEFEAIKTAILKATSKRGHTLLQHQSEADEGIQPILFNLIRDRNDADKYESHIVKGLAQLIRNQKAQELRKVLNPNVHGGIAALSEVNGLAELNAFFSNEENLKDPIIKKIAFALLLMNLGDVKSKDLDSTKYAIEVLKNYYCDDDAGNNSLRLEALNDVIDLYYHKESDEIRDTAEAALLEMLKFNTIKESVTTIIEQIMTHQDKDQNVSVTNPLATTI